MKRRPIPSALRRNLEEECKHRCGYCLTPQRITGDSLEVDHLVPVSLGGLTRQSNLWLACSSCNQKKGPRIEAIDPTSGLMVDLFNPRKDAWKEHFEWSRDRGHILGLTPTGRATISSLDMNRTSIVQARLLWARMNLHPPGDL